jgi:hypothetical protein
MNDRAEEQREREGLWMFERARLSDGVAHHPKSLIRKSFHHQGPGELAAAEDARINSGFPYAWFVKLRLIQLEPLQQMLVSNFELAEVKQRRAEIPLANHLEIRIAQSVEQVQHLECDVARRQEFA